MCEICVEICNEIADTFGHVVEPNKLARLIEASPLVGEGSKYDGHKKSEVTTMVESPTQVSRKGFLDFVEEFESELDTQLAW